MCGSSIGSAVLPFIIECGGLKGFANAEYFVHASRILSPLFHGLDSEGSVVRSGTRSVHLKL